MDNTLYRYRKINTRTLEGLGNSDFFFTSPESFNDPFDCKNIFTFEGSSDNDFKKHLRWQLNAFEPTLSQQEIHLKVESEIKIGIARDKQMQAKQLKSWRDIQENAANQLGIVCLSKNQKDILMWSHYADSHRGICLKFDQQVLAPFFSSHRVNYSPKYPTFKKFVAELSTKGEKAVYEMFLLAKSNHWKYEREYRLITDPSLRTDQPGERKYKYPEEALTGVIFGCQTMEKEKEKVREALKDKSHTITYFQAKKY